MMITKIVSGGQTGADRAALDWAIENKVPAGGWCPRKRLAEDGIIAAIYPLSETLTCRYSQRTEWNARDSDGTVIFTVSPELTQGSLATALKAAKHERPFLHLSREMVQSDTLHAARLLQEFVTRNGIRVLNVAGPRASKEPTVAIWVKEVLNAAFCTESPEASETCVVE